MPYAKTNWVDNATLLNAINLNNIEGGISDNEANIIVHQTLTTAHGAVSTSTASQIALRDANGNLVAKQLKSDIAIGTAPLTVVSTTVVPNLNADMLDGLHSTDYAKTAQEPWIIPTFLNGWVNFDVTTDNLAFYKDSFGWVHIRGVVTGGTALAAIFVLPIGYRPLKNQHRIQAQNNSFAVLTVLPDGTVGLEFGNNAWLAMDVSFMGEQ